MSNALLVLALSTAALSGTASAAPLSTAEQEERSVAVSYRDLDLGSDEGVATLRRRLVAAAKSVCESEGLRISSLEFIEEQRCMRESLSRALATMDRLVAQLRSATRVASANNPID